MKTARICARGVLKEDNKIYIIREDTKQNVDCWFLPGGGIEPNENIYTGLKRELEEELGIPKENIKVDRDYIGVYTFKLDNGVLNVNMIFEVDFPIPKSIKNQGEQKVQKQKLVSKEELTDFLADSVVDEFENELIDRL